VLKVSVSLMLFGRLFHNKGPFTEKALPPYVLRLYRGTTRSLLEEERKDLVGLKVDNNPKKKLSFDFLLAIIAKDELLFVFPFPVTVNF